MAKQIGIKKTRIVTFSLLLGGLLAYWWLYRPSEVRVFFENPSQFKEVIKFSKKLNQLFRDGDADGYIRRGIAKCDKIELSNLYRSEITQCNPEWLECVYENEKLKKDSIGTKFNFVRLENGKIYETVARSMSNNSQDPFLGYKFKIKDDQGEFEIILSDTCHRVKLPNKEYIYREHTISDKDLLIWSTQNQRITIDKFLVTYEDIWRWQQITKNDVNIPHDREKDLKFFILPADSLTEKKMNEYCEFRGGHVLKTRELDAAAFFPLKNNEVDRAFAPYPWSLNRFNQDLFLIKKGDLKFDIKSCFDYYFMECLSQRRFYAPYSKKDLSWIGVGNLIGGYPEFLNNDLVPFFNVRASSMYLPASHPMHRNGTRLHWTGEDFLGRSFLLDGQPFFGEIDAIKLGFRCAYNG